MMDRPARLFRGPRNGEVLSVEHSPIEVAKAPGISTFLTSEKDPVNFVQVVKGRYELRIRHGHPVVLKDGNYAFDWQGWDAPPKKAKNIVKGDTLVLNTSAVGAYTWTSVDYAETAAKHKGYQTIVDDPAWGSETAHTTAKTKHQQWLKDWHAELKSNYIKQITHSAPLFKDITSA